MTFDDRLDGRGEGFSRRALLAGGSAAVAAGALGAGAFAPDANAAEPNDYLQMHGGSSFPPKPAPLPKPIPGGVPLDPNDPNSKFIHWFLPGPTDAFSPIIGLQGMGLDVEPSSITDFKGKSAFAILAGEAETTDGPQLVEFDVRVMEGTYVAENGQEHTAAFAFF